jgi:hypothetical protein
MFPKKKSQNARRFKRLQANYLIKFLIPGVDADPKDPYFLTHIKDIGAGGVKFWSERFIPEGTVLQVKILVPPLKEPLETNVEVMRIRTAKTDGIFYIGTSFIDLDDEQQRKLNDLIESMSQEPKAKRKNK